VEALRTKLREGGFTVEDHEREDTLVVRAAPVRTWEQLLEEFTALDEFVKEKGSEGLLITHFGNRLPDLSPEEFFSQASED
jgi:hypothetical protein